MTHLDQSLEQLKADCQQQLDHYHHQGKDDGNSSSCLEIVRRAAEHVKNAFETLWEITKPLVKCPPQLTEYEDDLVQGVSIRLLEKFYHSTNPFRPSTFPAYRSYMNLIIRSVTTQMYEYQNKLASIEQLQEESWFEPATSDPTQEIIRNELAKSVLAMLSDPQEREVFRRKHLLGETAEQIVEALLPLYPDITKKRVFRLLELAMRRLRRNPNIQNLR